MSTKWPDCYLTEAKTKAKTLLNYSMAFLHKSLLRNSINCCLFKLHDIVFTCDAACCRNAGPPSPTVDQHRDNMLSHGHFAGGVVITC